MREGRTRSSISFNDSKGGCWRVVARWGREFPDQLPELTEVELAEVEDEATKEETQSLIGMTVLMPPGKGEDLEGVPLLTTKLQ